MNSKANNDVSDKMRVLYVANADIIIRMMLPQLDALRAQGFTVEVACNLTRHAADMHAHADAVHVIPFHRSPIRLVNLVALWQLVRLLRARRYHLVHTHTPVGGFVGRLAATLARVPVRLYTAHGFHFHRHGGRASNLLYRVIETIAGRLWSDGVIVINEEDYEDALRFGVVSENKLFRTGGVGVSTGRFDPQTVRADERKRVREDMDAADDTTPVLTMIAEMIPRKRHADMLEAFAAIRARRPDARLILVGEGVRMDEVKARAQELGVMDGCRFLGFRRDIPAVLAATDLFVFPSSQEGLPCAIQEALSMETPVVAADVRGSRDLVQPGCGTLVPLGDTAAFAQATLDLLALAPSERAAMGRNGRDYMIAEYERDACVHEWLHIYAALLGNKGLTLPARTEADDSARTRSKAAITA